MSDTKLEKKCPKRQSHPPNDICIKWLKNKGINPETGRKIKVNGPIYKKLEKKCGVEKIDKKPKKKLQKYNNHL